MKNKKLVFILLPLVLGIWITIIVKIFSFAKTPQYVENKSVILNERQVKQKVDTFIIVANYPDPFLKKEKYSEANAENAEQNNKKDKEVIEKKDIVKSNKWSQLAYYGLVNNNTKNQRIGFLKIDDKDFLVKKGDTIMGIYFENIYNDSIMVNFKEESRIIKKKQNAYLYENN